MSLSQESSRVINQWLTDFKKHKSSNLLDDPNYYVSNPESLITSSEPQRLLLGTGHQLFQDILPHLLRAENEILFVTCFWATSASQATLSSALKALSARALTEHRRIRVRIGFSSRSLCQKLTQTASTAGKLYTPSTWVKSLGLPSPLDLRGLDLVVRSVFVHPFSVMHSKFIIVDRQRLFMPSCNVSWEDWFEGCIELRGGIVDQASLFWDSFWEREDPQLSPQPSPRESIVSVDLSDSLLLKDAHRQVKELMVSAEERSYQTSLQRLGNVVTVLLPSPHHRDPHFRPLSSSSPTPSPSPLNLFLLMIFDTARQSIYIQSPNVNSPPMISAILAALERGIDVKIVSNTKMMVLEQLGTAGRLTECALAELYRNWRKLQKRHAATQNRLDAEPGTRSPGNLEIFYYHPPKPVRNDEPYMTPIKSHIKLTIVDEEIAVLGSGNMDRASWYTSQELGVAFFSQALAQVIMDGVNVNMDGHLRRMGGARR